METKDKVPMYQKNLDGVEVDPAEFLKKYQEGVPREDLVRIEV